MPNLKSNGCIVWSGNSLFDNQPIVVLLTGLRSPSHNSKTGWMLQTYVIHQNVLPTEAVKTGEDTSGCGKCPLRGKSGDRSCYVNLIPVNNVWRKYKSGGYPRLNAEILALIKRRRIPLRLTAYGEITAAPFDAFIKLLDATNNHTGYTHTWLTCDQRWQKYLMASIERPEQFAIAKSLGWRTFRVIREGDPLLDGEIMCRNNIDSRIQCEDCQLCNGTRDFGADNLSQNSLTSGKSQISIVDPVHGLAWKKTAFNKLV